MRKGLERMIFLLLDVQIWFKLVKSTGNHSVMAMAFFLHKFLGKKNFCWGEKDAAKTLQGIRAARLAHGVAAKLSSVHGL